MSCKPLINVVTTTSSAVATNGTLPLQTITRRRGRVFNATGNAITILDCGSNFYDADVTVTFTAPAAGAVSIALLLNGVAIPGATASTTITTATTEVRSLSFHTILRTFNCSASDTLTVVNTGVDATFSNIAVQLEQA